MQVFRNVSGNRQAQRGLPVFISNISMGECGIPLKYVAIASGIVSCIAYLPDAYKRI